MISFIIIFNNIYYDLLMLVRLFIYLIYNINLLILISIIMI